MVVVEVGAHAPTSHPSPSPLGIKTNLLTERQLGTSVFSQMGAPAMLALYALVTLTAALQVDCLDE